ncbi:hypothetical protein C6988_07875 [Nitrosopumilus sp. b1]|uniref:hypothetical protein n=1 Tax=Nitrosopumilus sp. b1 TaxID=2109907 RepID=UPI0015F703F8|nr:hypothetical protein [Nitrosopumilus sp. b1]KAF6242583.1 hypothetical protein C6988_07875 [Nitrosopumilus sp. b1]
MAVSKEKRKTSNSTSDHITNIAKILSQLEEKDLSKDWLLGELKRHKIRSKTLFSLNSFEILHQCSPDIVTNILKHLEEDDLHIKEVKALTKSLHWFFIDIIASSDPTIPVKSQARKINVLNFLIEKTETFKHLQQSSIVVLPTGDGMAIGFPDSPEQPLKLAIELHKKLSKYNKTRKQKDQLQIRIGIDTGPVYFMKGLGGGEIFWGPGLIRAKRVMDLCGPNQIFASSIIAKDLQRLSEENLATMTPVGDFTSKHGEQLLIYNVYGKEFGKKTVSLKNKSKKESEDPFSRKLNFEFNSIEVRLEVTEPKTMMTHHTWIWNVRNISSLPLEQIHYNIGGDVPRDFSTLNAKITDDAGNDLKIVSLDSNKPLEKKFKVALARPIKKSKKGHVLKLEYDWEEPERLFGYVFSSKCKKFKYVFTIPSGIPIKSRVLEVIPDLGMKKYAESPPQIKYLKDKTVIVWESNKKQKIHPHDAFEFQW